MSKDIKGINLDDIPESHPIVVWYWDTWFYEKIHKPIDHFFYRMRRYYRWIRDCISKTVDFDALSTITLIHYHLKQVERSIANGYHSETEPSLKQLRIALKLLNRLDTAGYEEYYHNRAWTRTTNKWGKIKRKLGAKYLFEKENESNTKQVRKEWMDNIEAMNKIKARDMKWFWQIFAKYHEGWWD